MRRSITDKGIRALKPRAKRYAHPDPELAGHYVRVQPSGAKSFCAVARSPTGKQIWTTIAAAETLTIAEARVRAREIMRRVRDGLPALEPKGETFAVVAANWLVRHVDANGLRSAKEIRRLLNAHVLPVWKDREFAGIRKSDVAGLLDEVEDHHSARQADYVLSVVRSIMNWYATRSDDYSPPIARGMKRQKTASRARVLDDVELGAIWRAAEEQGGVFAGVVRLALLTAQRSRKVAAMQWTDIVDGVWTVPKAAREKDTGDALKLPSMALDIIEAQPRFASNPHVFPARVGAGPFVGFGTAKAAFDAKLPDAMRPWVIHDLRRSARSLMGRAGVSSEHAERVLGHAIGGVEAIYDRYTYFHEKADALQRLAALVDGIVHPQANVLPMRRASKK